MLMIVKTQMLRSMADHEDIMAHRLMASGDVQGAKLFWSSASSKYEYLAREFRGDSRMNLLNLSREIARRAQDSRAVYRISSKILAVMVSPDGELPVMELRPETISAEPVRDCPKTHELIEKDSGSAKYVYRVEIPFENSARNQFAEFRRRFPPGLLTDMLAGSVRQTIWVRDSAESGLLNVGFQYKHTGYLKIFSTHPKEKHEYMKGIINTYGASLDRIFQNLKR